LSSQRPRLLLDENIGLRVYEELKRRGMKFKQSSRSYAAPQMRRFPE